MIAVPTIPQEISDAFGPAAVPQETHDRIPTFWVAKDRVPGLLRFLKEDVDQPYKMLYDLSAIDERMRIHRDGQPASDFTVVYHLLSFERNAIHPHQSRSGGGLAFIGQRYGHLARRELVRARSVGHVRDRV